MTFGCAPENHHLPLRSVATDPAASLVPMLLEWSPDGLDRVVASNRHLSEVSRPSGDIIGWSPAHPFGFSRVYLTRHLPPSSFLSSSTACASADSPALFHAGAAPGVSRTRPSSVRRGWRREMERPGRPRAQWQCCRSSTAMPGDQRWSVDRSRTSDWNRSRIRASAGRVQQVR